MAAVVEVAVQALEPFVGRVVAETCVRATALSSGKLTDQLCSDDLPALEANIRKLLAPVAPVQAVDRICTDIREGCLA